ncbi:NAD(P)H-dependent flavin oxidoreductase [Priestia endophytica]|jgi:NADH:quinone reductase (non-electrogenic)|uniref:NAD(P)H-dependent flavin oxidoreductase n=1 Tax=Priestia endophytica TaxID=135735 RepID=UPI002E1AF624|nr:nitronate monooxygenase family protein [Priestia endophytica]
MKTRVTELLNIQYPIVQGGLAHLAYAELASAVSNAGGLGQITAMTIGESEKLRKEIRKTKELTKNPFGVNFAIGQHATSYEELLEVVIEEEVPVISITGANPKPIFERLQGEKVKKLVLVANVRQAQKAESLGADAVMAVGNEGGGHLGRDEVGTVVLIPRVVQSVSIPVLASGGIGTGRGLLAALSLGADGIEMGTRFIATKECVHAHQTYKKALLTSSEQDTVIIKKTWGAPGRVLKSAYTNHIIQREREGATYEDLKESVSGEANKRYIYEGEDDKGFGWAGQVVGLIDSVPSVQELIGNMVEEARHGAGEVYKMFKN